jgi:hypothetical protein
MFRVLLEHVQCVPVQTAPAVQMRAATPVQQQATTKTANEVE